MIPRLLHHVWLGPRELPGQWSAAWGESSRWSMRMPLFRCHAPAW